MLYDFVGLDALIKKNKEWKVKSVCLEHVWFELRYTNLTVSIYEGAQAETSSASSLRGKKTEFACK